LLKCTCVSRHRRTRVRSPISTGPIVESTSITFEENVPSVDEMRARIENTLRVYPWIVAEDAGTVLGYA
jgi:hypothetical protein